MCETIYNENTMRNLQTPCYIFDFNVLSEELIGIKKYISKENLTYSMKANPFLISYVENKVGKIEVCSLGELEICIVKDIIPENIVAAGINKADNYLIKAVQYGVKHFVVESRYQWDNLKRICSLCGMNNILVSLRVNIGNQFGMSISDAAFLTTQINDDILGIEGIHIYMGTQNYDIQKVLSYMRVLDLYLTEIKRDTGFVFQKITIGCGVSVKYFNDKKKEGYDIWPDIVAEVNKKYSQYMVEYELGRKIAASCGKYVTKVVEKKKVNEKTYVIVDGGTHQLNYYNQMFGRRIPFIKQYPHRKQKEKCTVCGSLCSASDILAFECYLSSIQENDYLCFENAGAYSVTEGAYLFLSHSLPAIYTLDLSGKLVMIRDAMKITCINGG